MDDDVVRFPVVLLSASYVGVSVQRALQNWGSRCGSDSELISFSPCFGTRAGGCSPV